MLQPKTINITSPCYINVNENFAFKSFSDALYSYINTFDSSFSDLVFVCIGTDRATGDSLGPLIGYKLQSIKNSRIHVYGNLESPVHAKNLESTLDTISSLHKKPFIVAIDACLGKMDHIGYVTVGMGSLKPGAGVQKNLPEVGDISITGIVNFSGFMDMVVLQNTRLHIVMKMADVITTGIKYSLWKNNNFIGVLLNQA